MWLKAYITVTYNFLRHTMYADPVSKKHICHIRSGTSRLTRYKFHISRKTIYNSIYGIIAIGCRQRHNKIHGYMLKWTRGILNRLQFSNRRLRRRFICLTNRASFNKSINSLRHVLPKETSLCHFQYFFSTKMTT
jgi:hypothetical protein